MNTILLMVSLAMISAPWGNSPTPFIQRHGIETTNGVINPPLTCDNNSSQDAVIYYDHRRVLCPRWTTVEVQK